MKSNRSNRMGMSVVCVAAVFSMALFVHAQDEKATKGNELTLENMKISKDELPAGCTLSEELHCVSIQAETFYEMPDQAGLLPEVKGKTAQSLVKEGEAPGTFIMVEYEEDIPEKIADYLNGVFWGSEGGPTAQHPEEMCITGRFVFVLSFERGSTAAKWLKKRIRNRFNIRLGNDSAEQKAVLKKVYAAYEAGSLEVALKVLAENKEAVDECSLAQFLGGEVCLAAEKWEQIETFMRRAIELDADVSPLPSDSALWAAHDALGISLIVQKKYKEAAEVLTKSRDIAVTLGGDGLIAKAEYNLACACARAEKYKDAHAALKACIALDPSYKEKAKSDADFEKASKRKEFKELLNR